MNIDEINSMASVCSGILRLHFSDHMDDNPYYHYGLEPSIDKFIDILNPFVIGMYGVDLTDKQIDVRYFVQCRDSLQITIQNFRYDKPKHLPIPYSVLTNGIERISNYNKEVEYQILIKEMQTLTERMRLDNAQMAVLNTKMENLLKDKWWV